MTKQTFREIGWGMGKNNYNMMLKSYVYMLTNWKNEVLYTGVTSDLQKRICQHRNHDFGGFSAKYKTHKVVYIEEFTDIRHAIEREKQIKSWSRKRKDELIESLNPGWKDLWQW